VVEMVRGELAAEPASGVEKGEGDEAMRARRCVVVVWLCLEWCDSSATLRESSGGDRSVLRL
jgi:hypothetical protein